MYLLIFNMLFNYLKIAINKYCFYLNNHRIIYKKIIMLAILKSILSILNDKWIFLNNRNVCIKLILLFGWFSIHSTNFIDKVS